jgi:hypothetical protein
MNNFYFLSQVSIKHYCKKLKLSLLQDAEAHNDVRCQGSHNVQTISSQMMVVSLTRQLLVTPQNDSGTHFYYRLSDPRAVVWLGGLDQLKNPLTSLGIKPTTFQLLALLIKCNVL